MEDSEEDDADDVIDQEEDMQDEEEKQVAEVEEEEEEEEEIDDGVESEDPVKSIKAFKRLVVSVLEENEMDKKRACKMEIIDFLNLLKIMNEKGIHFK